MAPNYSRPAAPVAPAWPNGPAYTATVAAPGQKPIADIPWQEFFVDPQLRKLIAQALENNRDLRIALLNIERSQGQFQIRRSDLFPKVDANASGTFQQLAEDFAATGARHIHQYNVGLGISSYEVDLFGRVRSLKDQALEQYLATEQARRTVQITLVSQVSTAWLTLAADRERLQVARETLTSQQEAYLIIQRRFDAGVASLLELNDARGQVEAARRDIAVFTTLVAQDENALTLAVGSPVAADLLPATLTGTLTALKEVAPGLPSEVLLRRPDILAAENLLKGANANIGAARAAFFPRITLISNIGVGSNELGGLFTSGSYVWKVAPQISFPIFDAGYNKANLAVAEADRNIAVAQYEKAIQSAFREVSDALALRGTIDEQVAAQQALTDALIASYNLSQVRYEKGVDSYLSVLIYQRSSYVAQQNLIVTRLARLNNLVTLYKVLGGGSE
jgi:multidrug efflux system outer membrane protein